MNRSSLRPPSLTLLLCLALLLPALPALAQPTDEDLNERQWLAENGDYLLIEKDASQFASGPSMAEAMDIPAAFVTSATVSGPSAATAVFNGLGVIQPRQGDSFALLSTGVAGTFSPEPGADFSPLGSAGDSVTLTLVIDVPEGFNRLHFDFNFLSAEFPDFIGSIFNDTFRATLSDAGGSRQIAFASVNSSFFFAASSSRAGGSGFAIFTEDPSGVDTSFGNGLPDAGLTDFQSIEVPITPGGPATLVFNIRDLGDGILDSAVILDNLVITSLETLDPRPGLLSNGAVTADTDRLAQGGRPIQGAAADGVTQVLLRTTVPGPGSVELSLVDAASPEDGGVAAVGSANFGDSVMVPVVETPVGFQAFGLYKVPEDFNRGGDEALAERSFKLKTVFTPDNGDTVTSEVPFKLVRPPVMLIHGLWSKGDTWSFAMATDSRFQVTPADYEQTNARAFAFNRFVPSQYIREALDKMRDRDLAVTQVDVAGHSMGGILSRNHTNLSNYRNSNNFNEGDIDKLLTLNTPHTGSPLGNFIVAVRDSLGFVERFLLVEAARALGHAIDEGAIDDLAKGSAAINAIQAAPVPANALVGVGGSDIFGSAADALENAPSPWGPFFQILNFFGDITGVYENLQHDLIVGRKSQEGGMPPSAFTIFHGLDSIHTSVTSSVNYSNRVIELFNSPVDGPLFDEFPAPSTLFQVAPGALETHIGAAKAGPSAASQTDGLLIVSPPAGSTVVSGNSFTVTVEPDPSLGVTKVLVVGPGTAASDDTAPFEISLPVPLEAAGSFEILAVGSDGAGNFFGSNRITLKAVPAATLQSVRLIPTDPIVFGLGVQRQMTLVGVFDDGVLRDVTDPANGTFFQTSSSFIIQVASGGVITSNHPGIATVVGRLGSFQDSVSVTVVDVPEQENQPPVADAGPDQDFPCAGPDGALVSLDGGGSFDPDGDPLSFSWSGAFGTATGPTPTVALTLGTHTVTLTVDDGNGATDTDTMVIAVSQDVEPPLVSAVTPDPAMLWPVNHKMVPVTVGIEVSDVCDPSPLCQITGVTANEPVDGPGDGNTAPDFEITGDLTVDLRAERSGSGSSRIYEIGITCTDAASNTAFDAGTVVVPHDQR